MPLSSVNFMCRAGQRAPPQQIDHRSTHQPDPTFNLATQASRRSSQGKSTREGLWAHSCKGRRGEQQQKHKNTTTQSLVGVCQSHARADQPGEALICLAWAVGHVGFQGHGPLA